MKSLKNTENQDPDKTMSIRRTLQAPIEKVWKAWTTPESIARWWGPYGFTSTIHTMNLSPEGEWHLTMHGPDGKDYNNVSTFLKIEPLKEIQFRHYKPNYTAIILFHPDGENTTLDWSAEFETIEVYNTVVKVFHADRGLIENLDKLERYLAEESSR